MSARLIPNLKYTSTTFKETDTDTGEVTTTPVRLYFVPFTVNIDVTETSSALDSISAKYTGPPLRPGQYLSKADLSVIAQTEHSYDDNTTKYTEEPVNDFTFKDVPMKAGDNVVEVSYQGKTTKLTITVPNEKPDKKPEKKPDMSKPDIDHNDVVWHMKEQPKNFDKRGVVAPVIKDDTLRAELAGTENTGLRLAYDGQLPGGTTITVNLGKTNFNPGSTAYLYYYNDDTKKLEFIDKNVVQQNYHYNEYDFIKAATFKITHCSYYIVTDHELGKTILGSNEGSTDVRAISTEKRPNTGIPADKRYIWLIIICAASCIALERTKTCQRK